MPSRSAQEQCRVPTELRCEALLLDSYLRPTNLRCHHFASVKIDSRCLCGKHAQMSALNLCIKEGYAIVLPRAPIVARGHVRFVGQDEI